MTKHTIREFIDLLDKNGLLVSHNCDAVMNNQAEGLTFDTRELTAGALFVCKGAHFKKEYLEFAMNSGAVAYVSEKRHDGVGSGIIVSDIRRAMPHLAKLYFNDAPAFVTSIGITGTKGKSTTAYYMRSVLNEMLTSEVKPECAIVSSIDTYDGVVKKESHLTTPESIELFRHFDNALNSGISYLAMEVSSQALKYDRVTGVNFDVACFTNIGTDHISPVEHADFDDYFSSKLRIFDTCKAACINTDMDHADEALAYAEGKCKIVTFGSHETDTVWCRSVEKRGDAIYFDVKTPEYEDEFYITMPGLFNVSNALATIAMSYVLGIPMEYVKRGLAVARASGRMQVYTSKDERITVIVDYAHNRMSFGALYDSVKVEYAGRKVITVFGCPGNKAHLRRHDLGELSGQNSDYVVITEEDSGEEPFDNIARDIAKNVDEQNCEYTIIEDRGRAIRHAMLEYTDERRIILITGKGEETRQKRGTEYIDCPSDVEYTLDCLKEYDASAVPMLN